MTISRSMLSAFMAVLILSVPAGLQGQVNPVDAWEKRFNDLQPPDKVIEAIGVRPGMVIGEIGAGRGRYTVHLAGAVGPGGKVFANDIDAGSLDYLRERCQRDGIGNIVTILGRMDDPLFPSGSLDMVFMVNTYHHLARPVILLKNLIPSLKPEAIVAVVELDPEKSGAEFQNESTSQEALRQQADDAGFEVVRIETFLEKDNIFILRVKKS